MAAHRTLSERIPERGFAGQDDLLDAFLGWVADLGLELYAHQQEAILEIVAGHHVVLDAPTGSGKSLVAIALHFKTFAEGGRAWYTAPVKALVSQKFFELCEVFGAEHVGMATGDGTVNRDAPIVCCTTEILANLALRQGDDAPVTSVVMDEFHYYGDRDRGMAWQIPLLTLSRATFLLMSGTLGDTEAIRADLAARTEREVTEIRGVHRPVPLEFTYSMRPIHDALSQLARGEGPRVRRPLHPAGGDRAGAGAHQRRARDEGGEGRDRRRRPRLRIPQPVRPDRPQIRVARRRAPPRGAPPTVPPPGGAARPAGPAQGHLRDRHPRGGHQRPHPHRVVHPALQVRRRKRRDPRRAGLPTDRGPRGSRWIRHRRVRRVPGPGPRDREREGDRHRPEASEEGGQGTAADPRLQTLGRADLPAARGAASGDPREPVRRRARTPPVAHATRRAVRGACSPRGGGAPRPRRAEPPVPQAAPRAARARRRPARGPRAGGGGGPEGGGHSRPRPHAATRFQPPPFAVVVPARRPRHPRAGRSHPSARRDHLGGGHPREPTRRPVLPGGPGKGCARPGAEGERSAVRGADGSPRRGDLAQAERRTDLRVLQRVFGAPPVGHARGDPSEVDPPGDGRDLGVVRPIRERARAPALGRCAPPVPHGRLQGARAERSPGAPHAGAPRPRPVPAHDARPGRREPVDRVGEAHRGQGSRGRGASGRHLCGPQALRRRIRAELHGLVRALAGEDWEEAAQSVVPSEAWGPSAFRDAVAPFVEEYGPIGFDARTRMGEHTSVTRVGPHQWTVRQRLLPRTRVQTERYDVVGHTDAPDDEGTWAIEGEVDLRGDTDPSGPIVRVTAIAG